MNRETLYQEMSEKRSGASLYSPVIRGKQGKLYCTLYTAGDDRYYPIVVLAHGFPGHEKSLDIAQFLRKAGFHVLFFSYSGCWGSEGIYSFQNSLDDTSSVVDFILQDEHYHIDKNNIFFLGHSLGCISAAYVIATRPEVRGGAFIMPCDLVQINRHSGKNLAERKVFLENLDEGLNFLHGETAEQLLRELENMSERFSFLTYIEKLAYKPVLWISSKTDEVVAEEVCTFPVMNALKKYPGHCVKWHRYETDHYFSTKRTQVAMEVTNFFLDSMEHRNAAVNYSTFQQELQELIGKNYQTLKLKDVAEHFHLNSSYTSALIKQLTGKSLSELLLDIKMEHAASMLRETALPVHQIAACLGYESAPYFMNVFKKYYDMTPSGYRSKHKTMT